MTGESYFEGIVMGYRDEVTGKWRRWHNEELNDLYFSPNIVWVRRGGCIGSWWGNQREIDHWGDLGIDGWIILEWICRRCVYGLDWAGPG